MGTASKTRAPLWHLRQLCVPRGWMFSRLLWVPTPRSEVPCVFWQIHCSGWFCCLCGRGRSPLGMTSSPPSRAATKLQGADLKGGRKSWGWASPGEGQHLFVLGKEFATEGKGEQCTAS